jgi:hypothetical protein
LPWNRRSVKLAHLPIYSGICPVKSLSEAHNVFILVSLESDDGKGPLKPALSIYNCSSLARFPNSEGREPFKLFEPKPLYKWRLIS